MLWITEASRLTCKHDTGKVQNVPSQEWLKIAARRVLVADDPQGCTIDGCLNVGPTIKPCTSTLKVEAGYSDWIRIGGRWLCLDAVTGLTDGTPPGAVKYIVADAAQDWVRQR